jgi:penicillin-binding protein 1C
MKILRKVILRTVLVSLIVIMSAFVLLAISRATLICPSPTYHLKDQSGRFICEINLDDETPGSEKELGYWPLEEIPHRIATATISIEDRRFYSHPGVDPIAICRAIYQNLKHKERISGASTLAMQIARMQHPASRSWFNKSSEILTALFLTIRYGHDEILKHYLRIAPYGNRVHGIALAARRYFDKPLEDLSWAEAAFLTAQPQAPGRMNPYQPSFKQRAIKRGKQILNLLYQRGEMSPSEFELAMTQIGQIYVPVKPERPEYAMHAVFRMKELLSEEKIQKSVKTHPLIQTSLDLTFQQDITEIVSFFIRNC